MCCTRRSRRPVAKESANVLRALRRRTIGALQRGAGSLDPDASRARALLSQRREQGLSDLSSLSAARRAGTAVRLLRAVAPAASRAAPRAPARPRGPRRGALLSTPATA